MRSSGRKLLTVVFLLVWTAGLLAAQQEEHPQKLELERYTNFNEMEFVLVPSGTLVMGNDGGVPGGRQGPSGVLLGVQLHPALRQER